MLAICTWLNGVYWLEIVGKRPDGLIVMSNLTEGAKRKIENIQAAIEPDLLYPLLRGRDVHRWQAEPQASILITHEQGMGLKAIPEPEMAVRLPKTYAYLKHFDEILRTRSGYRRYFRNTDPFYSMYNVGDYTFAWYSRRRLVPDYPLTEAEAERILQLPKWIDTEPQWQQNEYGDWIMRVPVLADEQVPLEWYARFNPRTGNYTSILFWQRINLRRLDVGKLHHNPDCQNVGRIHKHCWTDAARNHVAYEPAEMARNDEVMTTLQKFLAECGITLRVALRNPPTTYQRDLGL